MSQHTTPDTTSGRGAPLHATTDGGRNGLRFERFFTRAGVHPYDELEWELRDAVINNWRDGAVSFEQRGVEFPSTWSMNATTIVAQKYFRGQLGTPQRERSVKQMIDRVADTITGWGRDGGYFVDEESAQVFDAELKHLLVNQKAAFNSPVWFNVGVEPEPQCSACQPWHALVSTPRGNVPIGRIVDENLVGMEVFDSKGTSKVVAVQDNGTKRVYRVQLGNGSFVEATGDHVVRAVHERRTPPQWLRVDELRRGMRMHLHTDRVSEGLGTADELAVSEAALAGWLQADGFVGQYDHGTNRSLTMEFEVTNPEEEAWVKQHLDVVFPDVHRTVRDHERIPGYRRVRLYGEVLRPFVEKYGLLHRRHDIRVPKPIWTAPLDVVRAYLASVWQSEGYVTVQERSACVGFAVISEQWTEDLQLLLLRMGIYSRRYRKIEKRDDRSDIWAIDISNFSERARFNAVVGFLGWDKQDRLDESLLLPGRGRTLRGLREEPIVGIEDLGEQRVYDIQTESGEYLSNSIVVHNCFILSVEDTMSSILNWYVEEGTIFKGGSGSGINLSTIRSSKEQLKGGGEASGPVSFMRGADASAGTIKSGGKTRRAAKMVILNVDHPDIEEFIWTKAHEEKKVRALREAGFDMDLDSPDYASVQYQNANNSVRVTDEFMRAWEEDRDYDLRAITTGEVIERRAARDVMRQISQAAWESADPGLQYDTTINDWHTTPESGRINGSNPCSEYMHLDNSACNLASLNLKKFYDYEADRFDVEAYKRAVEVVITAQEILVTPSSYPTEKIGKNARDFRELGLGYSNLGSLLMSLGYAYDSDEGRAWAGALTALMTGHAYRTSAETARVVGPFAGYKKNEQPMLRVIGKHRDAVDDIDPRKVPEKLLGAARQSWDEALELGTEHGFRNSQASVIAPTGTISFLMDCDTTGLEPDLGLVKTKKLVGGGSMSIVNQTVPAALERLGYTTEQIEAVVAHIDEHKTIHGAPALRDEHFDVFSCAMGDNAIHYMGHVRMMAAIQPFISGALSKTCNVPEEATVEDIEQLHYDAWKLGIKAIAIYRDNCKVAQPLSVTKKEGATAPAPASAEASAAPVRRKLPKTRPSQTISFRVGDAKGYVTAGEYPGDGLGEIFVKLGKQGSTLSGLLDAFAISMSIGLQYGVPLETYVAKFMNMRFEPAGMTDDQEVRFATSLVDYLARKLAIEYLPYDRRESLGIFTLQERTAALDDEEEAPSVPKTVSAESMAASEDLEARPRVDHDAPMCFDCGIKMVRAGACHVCESCGTTSGCS